VVPVQLTSDENAIYLQQVRDLGDQLANLGPRPWGPAQLDALEQVLRLCSHFAPKNAPKAVIDASGGWEAAQALLKYKSGLVNDALLKAEVDYSHRWEMTAMGAEDRPAPAAQSEVEAKKAKEAADTLRRLHQQPMAALRSLEYFNSIWQLLHRELAKMHECQICFEEQPLRNFSLLGCGHLFCTQCLSGVCNSQRSRCGTRCPFCRDKIVSGGLVHAKNLQVKEPEVQSKSRVVPERMRKYGSKLGEIILAFWDVRSREPHAKVILFTQWQSLEDKISGALTEGGISHHRLSTCKDIFERRRILESFQDGSDNQVRVLLMSLDGHASGTNLTCATHVFLVHPMVAPTMEQQLAYERQAVGRAVRLGQRKKVTVWRFVTEGTIEEEIVQHARVS